jgi:hypothetical protein
LAIVGLEKYLQLVGIRWRDQIRVLFGIGPYTRLLQGDHALVAILRMHGSIMNGGVINATEILEEDAFVATLSSYQFFGFESVSDLLVRARKLQCTGSDVGSQEAFFDSEYNKAIPDDSFLFSVFERYYAVSPGDFASIN